VEHVRVPWILIIKDFRICLLCNLEHNPDHWVSNNLKIEEPVMYAIDNRHNNINIPLIDLEEQLLPPVDNSEEGINVPLDEGHCNSIYQSWNSNYNTIPQEPNN